MADYNISAEITADASGFESGVKKAQKASKNLSKSLSGVIQGLGKSGLVGALGAVGLASQGVTATLGAVQKIARKVSETIDECTQAYRRQYQAEIALETAIKNNPLVDGSATRGLKQFASEIQNVSNLGDEELLPMMADLIAKGRTEAETMDIIRAATDMSASGTISFENAIQQLNATLNGNIGRLGQQNAELKDLTEEELKNGKAVEILGNKYKGLAEATADTKKQLNNAIGDFKETIGQVFDNAFAPMRKYFTEVISNLNNSIKKSRELKGATKEVYSDDGGINLDASTENLQIMWSEVLHKQQEVTRNYAQYMQLYGKYIDEATDETAQAYKQQIADLNADIKTISDELNRRKRESEKEQKAIKDAEEKAKKEKELAEAEKKNAEEREKALKLQSEWEDKLFASRIERLEKTKELELSNENLTQEQKIEIDRYYGDMILSMRIKQIEKERDEALNAEDLTEEAREALIAYYENKITIAKTEAEKERLKKKKEELEEEEKEEKKTLSAIVAMAKQATKKMAEVFKKVAETIKKVFSAIGSFIKDSFNAIKNIFSKLFEFNVSDALDNLLAVEDAILTFFVETLPRLPNFFESAFSSVLTLIQTLINSIDWERVRTILDSIIKTFITYAPQILSGIVELFTGLTTTISNVLIDNAPQIVNAIGQMFFTILEALPSIISNFIKLVGTYLSEIGKYITDNSERLTKDLTDIVSSIVEGISNFIKSGGWKNILSAILTIQKAIENAVVENLPALVDTIIDALPDLIEFLKNSIISASKTLGKIAKPIFKAIIAIIVAIIELLNDDDVIDQMVETFAEIIEGLIEAIIEMLPHFLTKTAPKVIKMIQRSLVLLPIELGLAFIKGLVKAFINTDWGAVVRNMFTGFIDSIKDFFGIHSPSTLFESFGEYMIEGLWNGINNFGGWLWDNIKNLFTNIVDGISDIFSSIGGKVSGAGSGIKNAFGNVKDFFSGLGEDIKNAFNGIGEKFKSVFSTASDNMKSAFYGVGDWFKSAFSTVSTNVSNAFSNFGSIAKSAWSNIKNGFGDVGSWFKSTFSNAVTNMKSAFSGLSTWFQSLTTVINNVFSVCATNLKNVMKSAGNYIKSLAEDIVDGLSSVGGTIKDAVSSAGSKIKSFFGFANGTQSAPRGLALVGEAGPELVRFRGGEQVLNNRNTNKALANMGGTTINQNVTFNNLQDTSAFAMIQQLKQYNRQMAINGVI